MAAKKTECVKREHVVVRVMRRGLNTYHNIRGPFTEAEANAFAMHGNTYGNNESYYVEHMQPLHHHEKFIIKGVQPAGGEVC